MRKSKLFMAKKFCTFGDSPCGADIVDECECGEYAVCIEGHGEIPETHSCEDIFLVGREGLRYDPRGERDREIDEQFLYEGLAENN